MGSGFSKKKKKFPNEMQALRFGATSKEKVPIEVLSLLDQVLVMV